MEMTEWPEAHGNFRLPLMTLQFYGALQKQNWEIPALKVNEFQDYKEWSWPDQILTIIDQNKFLPDLL